MNEQKTTVVVDIGSLQYRSLFGAISAFNKPELESKTSTRTHQENLDTSEIKIKKSKKNTRVSDDVQLEIFRYWRHLVINAITEYTFTFRNEIDELVLAFDSGPYWRKMIYPEYKGNRHKSDEETVVDMNAFFKMANEFFEDLEKTLTHIKVIKVDNTEADDIMNILSKYTTKNNKRCILVTTDGDMNQCVSESCAKYNPLKRKYDQNLDTRTIKENLLIKILTGDKGDNIFSIAPKIGPVLAKKIIDSDEVIEEAIKKWCIKKNFNDDDINIVQDKLKLNRALIDLSFTPVSIEERIINKYKEIQPIVNSYDAIFAFYKKYELKDQLVKLYSKDYKTIKKLF